MKAVINYMRKKTIILIIMGVGILIFLGIVFNPEVKSKDLIIEEKKVEPIKVKLTGAVCFPGEYEVEAGMTLAGVIQLAGGFVIGARYDNLNLAQKINDSMSLEIDSFDNQQISVNLSSFEEGKKYACIYGAVRYPGVYQIANGLMVCDLITMAGGLTPEADLTKVLLYNEVSDQMIIRIPIIDPGSNYANNNALINLNIAGVEELTTLKGIGKAKAEAIINYRTQNGSFKSIDELLKISGIGDGLFNQIKDYITI